MILPPPRSTRTDTLCPYTPLFRSPGSTSAQNTDSGTQSDTRRGSVAVDSMAATRTSGLSHSVSYTRVQTDTDFAMIPGTSKDGDRPSMPRVSKRPALGIMPTAPQNAAGIRTDPLVSEHSAKSTKPSATDTAAPERSEEHTSELQSLMRISYADFCL